MKTIRQTVGSLIVGIAFVCGTLPNLQAQITIQTPVVRADDYRTVLLRWNAEPVPFTRWNQQTRWANKAYKV